MHTGKGPVVPLCEWGYLRTMTSNTKWTIIVFGIVAVLLMVLPMAAWYAGRRSVQCPDLQAEVEKAHADLERTLLELDSAHAATEMWQDRYDSVMSITLAVTPKRIHETRDHLRSLGLGTVLFDSLGAKPE